MHATVLAHHRLEDALSYHLAKKIGGADVSSMLARDIFEAAMAEAPEIGEAVRADLSAVFERDPACDKHLDAFLFYKGFLALRIAPRGTPAVEAGVGASLALFLQSRVSELFGVDIHPAARLGRGIMIDHATAIVIGETAVVEDDVSILHGVLLGGTGKETGDRHPKIRRGVLISAGVTILGNIEVGEYAGGRRLGGAEAGAARLHGGRRTGRVVGCAGSDRPSQTMNQIMRKSEPNLTGGRDSG